MLQTSAKRRPLCYNCAMFHVSARLRFSNVLLILIFTAAIPALADDTESAPAKDPAKVAGMLAQANDLDTSGDRAGALQMYVDARQYADSTTAIDNQIETFVSEGLPDQLPPSLLPSLPLDLTPIEDLGVAAQVQPYIVSNAIEPQHGAAFPRVCYIFRSRTVDVAQVFCRVHYSEDQDADLAQRIGSLLLFGRHILVSETHHAPHNDDDQPFDVWLCRDGMAGGEQWRTNIYFYELDSDRSSIEWIREILHEYSHLALPAVGGFTAPEYWANGYLGERLLVRWIQRTPGGPETVEKLWGTFSGAQNFDRLLIAPPIELYRRIGPSAAWQSRTDKQGMDYFIGQVLTIDDKYGPAVIGEIFDRLPMFREVRPSDITDALKEIIASGGVTPIGHSADGAQGGKE